MSYILDALRKSERERALGNIRTLEAAPVAPADSGRGRALRWLVIILVLIAIATALGWAFADRLAEAMARLESSTDTEAQTAADSGSVAEATQTVSSGGKAGPIATMPATQPLAANPNSSTAVPAAEPPVARVAERSAVDGATPARPATPPVLSVHEAPVAVRDAMRRLSVSVVSYSREPERRFVMVNQVFYREGDKLPGGVKLRRIEPDGAVVAYRGSEVLLKP